MKLITTLFLGFSSLFAAVELVAPAPVDKAESQIRWEASKVTGTHWGYLPLKNATLNYSAGKITGGSFDMDMVNLTVEDLTDPKSKGNLTGNLVMRVFNAGGNMTNSHRFTSHNYVDIATL